MTENENEKENTKYSATDQIKTELKALLSIAAPIVASSFLNFLLSVVDLAFVGHLGRDEFAAASLGTAYYNTITYPLTGVAMALDTLLSQSFGARNFTAYGEWALCGAVVLGILCVPAAGLLMLVEPVLIAIGQERAMASSAASFVWRLIPGMPAWVFSIVITKYLQSQEILAPAMVVAAGVNVFNAAANYALIHAAGLGLQGAPLATSLSRWVQLAALAAYLALFTAHLRGWAGLRRSAVSGQRVGQFARLGAHGWAMIALEAWSFDMSSFLAGYLGPLALDAHSALLNTCGFMYMSFPLAVSISASIRVGHLLGAGLGPEARRSALTALGVTAAFQLVLCSCLLVGRRSVGQFFTDDEEVINIFAAIAPIACIFMIFDGAQSAMAGAFRGMGRQGLVAALNFIGFWLVGLSVGSWATFFAPLPSGTGLGVGGLWWGLGAGLFCTSAAGAVVLIRTDWIRRAVDVSAGHRPDSHEARSGDGAAMLNGCSEGET